MILKVSCVKEILTVGNLKIVETAYRCSQGGGGKGPGGGWGWYETASPRQTFEKLVNKNARKRKIGGPPLAIFPETLDKYLLQLDKRLNAITDKTDGRKKERKKERKYLNKDDIIRN